MPRRPLTIAHTECSLGWGGQEIRVLAEMRILRHRGHRLLLAAPSHSQIFRRAQDDHFTVHPLETARWKYPAIILLLARWLRRENVEVLNTHSSRDGWIGGCAGRLAHVPLLLRTRHIEVDYPQRALSRVAFLHLADRVITTSERIRTRLRDELGLPADRVVCLPTGQDLTRFDPAQPPCLPEELKLPSATLLIGMISVLRSWKGHEIFLTAAAALRRRHPELHFIIAGEGPMRHLIQEMIAARNLQEAVTLLGHRDDVPNILNSLTALVLPSLAHEGIPQIVLQAQAMGRPVIGSRVGGIPEVIEDGVTGLLIPPRNPAALEQAVLRLVQDKSLGVRLGAAARAHALKHYSVDHMADRLETIYFSTETAAEGV